MEKIIEVGGKKYTLTANRKIIKTINEIAPKLLQISESQIADKSVDTSFFVDLIANLDVLFHSLINVKHPEITLEDADKILKQFEDEYEGVQSALIEFATSAFGQGDQTKKKKLDW